MKHTFKADPGITVTVDVTPETEAHFGDYISRRDAIQLGSQALMLHAQELARPVEAEGEEVEPTEEEIEEGWANVGFGYLPEGYTADE